jgi:hypothetical protein
MQCLVDALGLDGSAASHCVLQSRRQAGRSFKALGVLDKCVLATGGTKDKITQDES